MKIYLVRHGESEAGHNDDKRILSEKGKTDIQHLASLLLPLHIKVSIVLQSKKERAQQTAAILMPSIHIDEGVETRKDLDPQASVNSIIDEITLKNKDVLLVGHMPFLGKLIGKLVMDNENKNIVALTPGSFVSLESNEIQPWLINWMLSPDMR